MSSLDELEARVRRLEQSHPAPAPDAPSAVSLPAGSVLEKAERDQWAKTLTDYANSLAAAESQRDELARQRKDDAVEIQRLTTEWAAMAKDRDEARAEVERMKSELSIETSNRISMSVDLRQARAELAKLQARAGEVPEVTVELTETRMSYLVKAGGELVAAYDSSQLRAADIMADRLREVLAKFWPRTTPQPAEVTSVERIKPLLYRRHGELADQLMLNGLSPDENDELHDIRNALDGIDDGLRPQVAAFARLMERELRANDHKGGWQDEHTEDLFKRLKEEVKELKDVISIGNIWKNDVIASEAADVANFAMMIVDSAGLLDAKAAEPGKTLETERGSKQWWDAHAQAERWYMGRMGVTFELRSAADLVHIDELADLLLRVDGEARRAALEAARVGIMRGLTNTRTAELLRDAADYLERAGKEGTK